MRVFEFWDVEKPGRRGTKHRMVGQVIVEEADELWPIKPGKGWPLMPVRVRPVEKEAVMAKALLVSRDDAVLANLNKCVELLDKCTNAEDAKKLMDIGVAAKVWAKRQKRGVDAQNSATEFVLHAKRKLGEILSETEKHPGGRPGAKPVDAKRQVSTLEDLGISRDLSSQAQQLAAVPEKQFDAAIADAKQDGKEISYARVVKQLLKGRPPDKISDAVVITPSRSTDAEEIIARIRTFIDRQLLAASAEVRVRVGQALQDYASQLIEQIAGAKR